MHKGPIVLVEDDLEDQDLIRAALTDEGFTNAVRAFRNGREAVDYLLTTEEQPVIILADIQMPVMNGLQMLKTINDDPVLHAKAIPFVYLTVTVSKRIVQEAFDLFAQGFFKKAPDYASLRAQLRLLLTYWSTSLHPNSPLP